MQDRGLLGGHFGDLCIDEVDVLLELGHFVSCLHLVHEAALLLLVCARRWLEEALLLIHWRHNMPLCHSSVLTRPHTPCDTPKQVVALVSTLPMVHGGSPLRRVTQRRGWSTEVVVASRTPDVCAGQGRLPTTVFEVVFSSTEQQLMLVTFRERVSLVQVRVRLKPHRGTSFVGDKWAGQAIVLHVPRD